MDVPVADLGPKVLPAVVRMGGPEPAARGPATGGRAVPRPAARPQHAPDDLAAARAALKKADFASVRGNFSFGNNQHPVQDIYIREVIQTEDGFTNKTIKKVFTNHVDAYAQDCKM